MDWNMVGAIATCFTAGGVIVALLQIRLARKQSVTQFEDEMSRQYREILKTIPLKALLGEKLSQEEFEEAEDGIYHYLDPSNEQVFLRQNNRVRQETWKSWCDGIESNLSRWAFEQVWMRIQAEVPNNFLELQTLQAQNFKSDPRCWRELIHPKTSS